MVSVVLTLSTYFDRPLLYSTIPLHLHPVISGLCNITDLGAVTQVITVYRKCPTVLVPEKGAPSL